MLNRRDLLAKLCDLRPET